MVPLRVCLVPEYLGKAQRREARSELHVPVHVRTDSASTLLLRGRASCRAETTADQGRRVLSLRRSDSHFVHSSPKHGHQK